MRDASVGWRVGIRCSPRSCAPRWPKAARQVACRSALRALISARLDALPSDERRALLRAAVLGKHVWQGGFAALDVDGEGSEHLDALEQRDLLRSQPGSRFGPQREYVFKHDLIQEMAYGLLPRAERRRLHARIVDWLEHASGERIEENLDLLAHHAVNAERHERALDYLARAAERSRRAAAYREEAALLEQAIQIAERSGRQDLIPEFRARRGRALMRVTLWADARRELEAALAGLPAEQPERRAEVLVDLALASNWSLDEAALRQRATEALELAGSVGRADLAMDARFWLAWAAGSEGDVGSAIDQYHAAVVETNELGVAVAPSVLPLFSTALCWAGRFELAIDRGREAVRIAREAGDTDSTILALQVLGLALAGTGVYDEAWQTFDEAIRFGRDYGIGPFLARAMAMSAGYRLDVFDFEGHAETAEEACELARSFNFAPPLVSASIDLLLNLCASRRSRSRRKAGARRGWPRGARVRLARLDVEPALHTGARRDRPGRAEVRGCDRLHGYGTPARARATPQVRGAGPRDARLGPARAGPRHQRRWRTCDMPSASLARSAIRPSSCAAPQPCSPSTPATSSRAKPAAPSR